MNPISDTTSGNDENGTSGFGGPVPPIAGMANITVDKSVEFSYEELATATNNFNMANMIGQGGFGSVYYAELRGEVCELYEVLFLSQSLLQESFVHN